MSRNHSPQRINLRLKKTKCDRIKKHTFSCGCLLILLFFIGTPARFNAVYGSTQNNITVFPFQNLKSSQDPFPTYLLQITTEILRSNGFSVVDKLTISSWLKTGGDEPILVQSRFTLKGDYYIFGDVIDVSFHLNDLSHQKQEYQINLKSKRESVHNDVQEVMGKLMTYMNSSKGGASVVVPSYMAPDTQVWLKSMHNRLFSNSGIVFNFDDWALHTNYSPVYYIEFMSGMLQNDKLTPDSVFKRDKRKVVENLIVQVYSKYPNHPDIAALCAELAFWWGERHDAAAKFAKKTVKLDPNNVMGLLLLSLSVGINSGESKTNFGKLLKVAPYLNFNKFSPKSIDFRGGMYDKFLLKLSPLKTEEISEAGSSNFDIKFNLTEGLFKAGKIDRALQDLLRLNQTYPDKEEVIDLVSRIYTKKNNAHDHLEFLLKNILGSSNKKLFYERIANIYSNGKEYNLAAKYNEKYYFEANKNINNLKALITNLNQSGQFTKALFYCGKYVSAATNDPDAYYFSAVTAYNLKNYKQSWPLIKKALKLSPKNTQYKSLERMISKTMSRLKQSQPKTGSSKK